MYFGNIFFDKHQEASFLAITDKGEANENNVRLPRQYMQKPDGRNNNEGYGKACRPL